MSADPRTDRLIAAARYSVEWKPDPDPLTAMMRELEPGDAERVEQITGQTIERVRGGKVMAARLRATLRRWAILHPIGTLVVVDKTLLDLAAAADTVRAASVKLDEARTRRDDLVAEAIAAGHSWSLVAAKAGMTTPSAVAQALKRVEKRRESVE